MKSLSLILLWSTLTLPYGHGKDLALAATLGQKEGNAFKAQEKLLDEGQRIWELLHSKISPHRLKKAPMTYFLQHDPRVFGKLERDNLENLFNQARYCSLNELLAIFYHLNEPLINQTPDYALSEEHQSYLDKLQKQISERQKAEKSQNKERLNTIKKYVSEGLPKDKQTKFKTIPAILEQIEQNLPQRLLPPSPTETKSLDAPTPPTLETPESKIATDETPQIEPKSLSQ